MTGSLDKRVRAALDALVWCALMRAVPSANPKRINRPVMAVIATTRDALFFAILCCTASDPLFAPSFALLLASSSVHCMQSSDLHLLCTSQDGDSHRVTIASPCSC